jgi:hypothetical protein
VGRPLLVPIADGSRQLLNSRLLLLNHAWRHAVSHVASHTLQGVVRGSVLSSDVLASFNAPLSCWVPSGGSRGCRLHASCQNGICQTSTRRAAGLNALQLLAMSHTFKFPFMGLWCRAVHVGGCVS